MDERLIEKIHGYKNGLELLKELKPVTYHKKGSDKKELGMIAQNVQELEPLAIGKNSAGLLVLQYEKLTCLLVNAVIELSEQVDELKNNKAVKKTSKK